MPFEYRTFVNPYAPGIADTMLRSGDIEARRAEAVANAQAHATEASAAAWGGAAQSIGQTLAQLPQQLQRQKMAALQQQNLQSEITDRNAQAQGRITAQQANAAVDHIMQTSLKEDPQTGVKTFDRPTFEQGLIQAGQGHLYPALAETLDKLDSSASKRNAEGRKMIAETLVGIGKAGYSPESVLSGAAFLKGNNVITDQHLQPVLDAVSQDPSPANIQRVVTSLGNAIPEYGDILDRDKKREADLAKTTADTAKAQAEANKANAEATGTMPPSPAQAETARHNRELERISNLQVGREAAANAETARHNRATEAQNEAVPALTPDAIALTAKQFAMTGQLPPMGMGKQGAKVRTDIINAAAEQYKNLDLPSQVAAYKANQQSLTKLQAQRDAIGAFESTAKKNIDLFLDTAGKVVDTGSPLANTLLRQASGALLGSPDQAAYDAARQVAVNEIAKITSNPTLAGSLSDTARKEIEAFNPQNATLAQSVKVMRLLEQDMGNRTSSLDDQLKAIRERIATPPGGAATPPAGATSGPADGTTRTVNGATITWRANGPQGPGWYK